MEVEKEIEEYLEREYKGIELGKATEYQGKEYETGYEMLEETDEIWRKLMEKLSKEKGWE